MERRLIGPVMGVFVPVVIAMLTGCASLLGPRQEDRTGSVIAKVQASPDSEATLLPVVATQLSQTLQAQPHQPVEQEKAQEKADEQGQAEEPFADPFSRPGEEPAEVQEYDPWEAFNTRIFNFNRKFDRFVLKPVATGYDTVLPDSVELAIQNFYHNVRFFPRLMNNLLQRKFKSAGIELSRFSINTTIGLLGFFDPGKKYFHLDAPPDEDFGQTLAKYGVGPGPYLVLPLLPPLTVRDAVGFLFIDFYLDPINYFLFNIVPYRFKGEPMTDANRLEETGSFFATQVHYVVNERAINLELFQGVEETTLDLYSAVRNGYLQKRAKEIAR